MKKRIVVLTLLIALLRAVPAFSQQWGVSTNILYWAGVTPNLGVEYSFHDKMSVALNVNYNPFTFSDNTKLKHLLVQPEYRYWLSEAFKGHYIGVHALGAIYNFSALPLSDTMRKYRYEGEAYGGGFTYGYQWVLGNRLNIGADIGFGYLYLNYDKYDCITCGQKVDHYRSSYFGPTKLGVNLIYLF